jgi:hypothetical protein
MTKKQYPLNDWEFVDDIENSFNEWFHGDYGPYSFRSEAFYTDCEIGDVKTRQSMLQKWIYASFYEAYQRGRYAKLEETRTLDELAQGLPTGAPDAL